MKTLLDLDTLVQIDGDTWSMGEPMTLGQYLERIERAYQLGGKNWVKQSVQELKRLLIIKDLVPAWLNLIVLHPLHIAIRELDILDFGALVGRAIVIPREADEADGDFTDPERLWFFASMGLATGGRVGRPEAMGTLQQIKIYLKWTMGMTQKELAEGYGVSASTIERIIRRWKPKKPF